MVEYFKTIKGNRYSIIGKSQRWKYDGGCEYDCIFHKGKVEFHHPCSYAPSVGIYLCEAHHSLLQGRKHRYTGEAAIPKTLNGMRDEIQHLVIQVLENHNMSVDDTNKK